MYWCSQCNAYTIPPHTHTTTTVDYTEMLKKIADQLERIANALENIEDDHKPSVRTLLD